MARTRLVTLTDAVWDRIENHFAGRPARLQQVLEDLVVLLATAEVPPRLDALAESGEVHRLRASLRRLQAFLADESHLPEALCCHYLYGQSPGRAQREWGVRVSEWRYVNGLARRLEAPNAFHLLYARHPFEQYPWHDALEERFVSVEVILDPDALDDMLLCAVEGLYAPRPGRRKGFEVCGVNLGMVKTVQPARRSGSSATVRYVYVMRSQPQLSAEGGFGGVAWREKGIDALLAAARTLFPNYQAVADFHSHPYDDFESLVETRGWRPSDDDQADNDRWFPLMVSKGERPQLTMILGIARCRTRVGQGHYRGKPNTLQVSVGDCRAILGAYRILRSGAYTSRHTRLRVRGMLA